MKTVTNDILDNLDVIVAEHENVYKMLMTNFATALMDVVTATDDTTAKESGVMLEVYSKQLNKFVLDLIANQQYKA